jgi:hypothetical protein
MADWDAYWKRQRWDRRWRHETLHPFLARLKRRIMAPRRWYYQARSFIRRGRHGWARPDLWGMDSYICQLLGEMTASLKQQAHGHPCQATRSDSCGNVKDGPKCSCEQDWNDILDRISGPLLAYKSHWDWDREGGETIEQFREREDKIISDAQDALRLMADHLPSLWD